MLRILLILLFPISLFSQTKSDVNHVNLAIDTTGKVSICLGDSVIGKVFLEQFKWNHWMVIDSVEKKTGYDTCYFKHIDLPKVRSDYRISEIRNAPNGEMDEDTWVILNRTNVDSCFISDCIYCKSVIHFKCDVDYKIYDKYGNIVKKGCGSSVDVSGLAAGGYFMMTPNKTYEFFKK